jgi:hypothetical protein
MKINLSLQNSKLIILLESLKNKERKQFRAYLESPYFNRNELQIRLFDEIDEHYFNLGNRALSKAYLWSRIFGEKPYEDAQLRIMMSDQLKMAEHFLSLQAFDQDANLQQRKLLEELNKRSLHKHFQSSYRKLETRRHKSKNRHAEFYLDEHLLLEEQKRFALAQQSFRSKLDEKSFVNPALDRYYLSAKLRLSCEILSTQNVVSIPKQEMILVDALIEHVESTDYSDVPSIPVYYSILKLLRAEDDQDWYEKLKTYVDDYGQYFPNAELLEIYTYAINHCIKEANRGDQAAPQELFNWYKSALEQELLLRNGYLMHWDYKNITAVGLSVKEYDWVRDFIEENRSRLPAAHRKNAYTYNLARFYFRTKDYDKVLQLLQRVEYEDVFYHIGAKTMLLEIYYELEEMDALFSLFDSFSIFLRRNKVISDLHRTNYLNLIKYLKRLVNTPRSAADKLEGLSDEIQSNPQVLDKSWLLAQCKTKLQAG